jgi:VCBS repeat-containing protein
VNNPPTAVDDVGTGFITDEDTPFTTTSALINDTDPEDDPLSITGNDTTGMNGLLVDNGDGTFSYDPDGQFDALGKGDEATDTFTYTISDGVLTDTATVTITITGINDTFWINLPLVIYRESPPPSETPSPEPTETTPPPPTETTTPPPPQPTPTIDGVPGFCTCTGPDLDCADFSTQNQAQACFEHCKSLGYGDVYRLDGDNDGKACEALP